MSRARAIAFVSTLSAVSACATDELTSPSDAGGLDAAAAARGASDGETTDGGAGDASEIGLDAPGAPACTVNHVPLFVATSGGVASRLHVPVTFAPNGDAPGAGSPRHDAALLVDTGSALSFVFLDRSAPAFVEHAGTIEIGCETLALPGRPLRGHDRVQGRDVVGILGADFFLAGWTELDVPDAAIRRHARRETAAAEGWRAAPFEDRAGHVLVDVTLDDEVVTLMVDTGAQHTLWLGREGRPGDVEVTTTDAEGTALSLWLGEAELAWSGDAPREVPVLRAPSFPYFEETVRLLGGGIDGLFGLGSFADRALVFDAEDGVLLRASLEPRVP